MMANKPIEVEKEEIPEKIINKEGEKEQPTKAYWNIRTKSNKNKNKKNKKGYK